MLVDNNLAWDSRVRMESETLAEMGLELTIIGRGEDIPADIKEAPYELVLEQPQYHGRPLLSRWGHENIWYPIRVCANLTVTRYRTKRYNTESLKHSSLPAEVSRPDMEVAGLRYNPDIVHCQDLDTLWAGYQISKRCGALLVYDSNELYLEWDYLPKDLYKPYAQVEAQVFPHLSALITVSPQIGHSLITKYDSDLIPIIIYNAGSEVSVSAKPVSDPVRLFFQGHFMQNRNNVELICAMQYLRGKATLTLQGWGPDEEEYRRTITELALEDTVSIIPPVPPAEVVTSANNYDIGVINYRPLTEHLRQTLPNKLFDYMCGGLAIAATSLPSSKDLIEKSGCGITYDQKGAEHTAQALEALISDPQRVQRMKQASLALAPKYAWPAQAQKLETLYRQLIEQIKAR